MWNWIKTAGNGYLKLFSYIEGPELEPTLFHSHYLSTHAIGIARRHVRARLRGDVLDVGAGTGHGKQLLPEDGANYFPTDIDGARDYQDSSLTRKGIPLVKRCTVYAIDYPDDRFDACLALSLFEHLQQPERAITEIKRVVKANGTIVLLVPFNFPVHGYPKDYWRWTVEGLKHFLRTHNVDVIECFPCGNSVHSIALNLNLFMREGAVLNGHKPSIPRLVVYSIFRPILTPMFFMVNVLALVFGTLDKSSTSPILICAVGGNKKRQ